MASKKFTDLGNIKAFLGHGTEFEGHLSFDGTVRVDGLFKGEVESDDCLIIGESGIIEAMVNVRRLVVMGRLIGNVRATGKVEIAGTGHIVGDILTPIIVIEEGGNLEGNIKMLRVEQTAEKSPVKDILIKTPVNEAIN